MTQASKQVSNSNSPNLLTWQIIAKQEIGGIKSLNFSCEVINSRSYWFNFKIKY